MPGRDATPKTAVPLPRAPGLHGRVYDEETGAPIGDARIMANPRVLRGPSERMMPVTTATDGTFVLEDLVPGPTRLDVFAPGYVQRTVEIVARDSAPPVEIGLSTGGAITGRLIAADGVTPVAGMRDFRLRSKFGHGRLDRAGWNIRLPGSGARTVPTEGSR